MKKKILIAVGVLFLAVMAGLTVWSRSIYQNSLPLVRLEIPRTGSLHFQYDVYGTAREAEDGLRVQIELPAGETAGDFPFYRGDAAQLSFPNEANSSTQGRIEDVSYAEDGIRVDISFSRAAVQAGDSVAVTLQKQSRETEGLLPSAAVQADSDPYLWLVDEVRGPWGPEYVLVKKYVSVLADDGERVMLASSVDKPVVVAASAPLSDGQAVRFYP